MYIKLEMQRKGITILKTHTYPMSKLESRRKCNSDCFL